MNGPYLAPSRTNTRVSMPPIAGAALSSAEAKSWVRYQEMAYSAKLATTKAEVAVEGTGMIPPRTRPGVELARERGGLVGAPHKGHLDAPRSISARQFGHMRCAESYDCSLEPSAESQLVFNLCSLNHNFGDKAIPGQYEGFGLKWEG